MDMTAFLNRIGWRQRELAEKLGVGTSAVGSWCTNRAVPSYEKIAKLLELGITMEELFGPEIAEKVLITRKESQEKQKAFNSGINFEDPAVKSAMAQALSDILKSTANKV